MSVINQVLNQLEQRGAQPLADQSMVRPVPLRRDTPLLKMALLGLGLSLAIGALTWQWLRMNKPDVVVASNVQNKPATMVVAAPPAEAVIAPLSGVAVMPEPDVPVPASRLSFELGSVALPASPRAEKAGVASAATPPAKPVREPSKLLPNAASKPGVSAAAPGSGDLPLKQVSRAQQADAEFRRAVTLMQQGRVTEAMDGYEAALRLEAGHDAARQALVALLLENKRGADAERVLQEGLQGELEHTGFAMLLARLQVERGKLSDAAVTLERSLPYADQQADYQAFFAAVLQRQERHKEAIAHYQVALRLAPNNGVWLMGYAISLQAVERDAEAKDAFKRALDSQSLSPDLQAFVQQRLKGL